MAGFEGVQWAPKQLQYDICARATQLAPVDATTFTISRSLHYGLFQVFEGIRFFCAQTSQGLELRFINLQQNLERFRRGILFSISPKHAPSVPTENELRGIFVEYFRSPELRPFLQQMAESQSQGYFRPFTLDEMQSIGVTFPQQPGIRAAFCRYDRYLGEPFDGVVIPNLVRAVSTNGTGCLKLGSNYLLSVKAVQQAQQIQPTAAAALFLDDRPDLPIEERYITEWDSSCCLIALRNGTVVSIADSPLILPSVTIQGIRALLRRKGVVVEERPVQYRELVEWVQREEVATICSIGTAGILNRCQRLFLVDTQLDIIATHTIQTADPLTQMLKDIRQEYWDLYLGTAELPADGSMVLESHLV